MRTRGCSFSYWKSVTRKYQLDLPDSRRASIMLLCHIVPLPSPFIVPSSVSTRSNAVPAVYPSHLILCHLVICILATIAAAAHRWHLWENIMDQVEGQFPAPRRCLGNHWSAIDLDVRADVLIPLWSEKSVSILLPCFKIMQKKKKKRWTDLLFLLIPILPCSPTHQSRDTDPFFRWAGRCATLTGDYWCKCK